MTIAPSWYLRRNGVLIVLAGVVALLWSFPLWFTVGKTGVYDWGFMENVWEVRWKTVLEYGQWPSHNPWQGGGIPDVLVPGFLSVQSIMTLLLGAKAGLSAFIIVYLILGVVGFYYLGLKLFNQDQKAAFFLSVVGPASSALAFHLTAGHLIFINTLAWPALLCWFISPVNPRSSGIKAGLLYGIIFNESPFYSTLYGTLLVGLFFCVRMISGSTETRRNSWSFLVHAAVVALPLVLPIILPVAAMAADYQRVANTPATFPLGTLLSSYFEPVTEMKPSFYVASMKGAWGTWEMGAYLGFGAFAFWLAGLVLHRPRWFHAALIGIFIFTVGNEHWWQPMHWLMQIPPFSSHQSFNRLRLFVQMFFAIGAAWGLHQLLVRTVLPWKKHLVFVLTLGAMLEIVLVSRDIVQHSHIAFQPSRAINKHHGAFYQRSHRQASLPAAFNGWPADLAQHTQANIGIVSELAAIPSQFRRPSAVKTVERADYIGEFVQHGRSVSPRYWSPNRLSFSNLDPAAPLLINLNRGYPWRNFDHPLFPHDRIVEFDKPFLVQPNAEGRVELTYTWKTQRESWGWALAAAAFGLVFCLYSYRHPPSFKTHAKGVPPNLAR
jgi:hypothetical protein